MTTPTILESLPKWAQELISEQSKKLEQQSKIIYSLQTGGSAKTLKDEASEGVTRVKVHDGFGEPVYVPNDSVISFTFSDEDSEELKVIEFGLQRDKRGERIMQVVGTEDLVFKVKAADQVTIELEK